MAAKPAGRGDPKPLFADAASPIGDPLADFLYRFDPVAAFVDDAGGKLHAFRRPLERIALDPLKEIFYFEGGHVDDAVEPLENIDPGRAVQCVRYRPAAQIAVAEMQRLCRFNPFKTGGVEWQVRRGGRAADAAYAQLVFSLAGI